MDGEDLKFQKKQKPKVRAIAKRNSKGLYPDSDEDKNKKRSKKTKRNSCNEDSAMKKLPKDDDDSDGNARKLASRMPSFMTGASAGGSHSYSFPAQGISDESPSTQGASDATNTASTSTAANEDSFATDSSRHIFSNPLLSHALGPLNNPYRSSGWVKTRCGMAPPPDPIHLPDDSDDFSNTIARAPTADPMWWSSKQNDSSCDEDFEIADEDDEVERDADEVVSDVEQGLYFF